MKLIKDIYSCHEFCSRILESIHYVFSFVFLYWYIVYYYLNAGSRKSSIWASDIYSSIADMIAIVLKWLSYFSDYFWWMRKQGIHLSLGILECFNVFLAIPEFNIILFANIFVVFIFFVVFGLCQIFRLLFFIKSMIEYIIFSLHCT